MMTMNGEDQTDPFSFLDDRDTQNRLGYLYVGLGRPIDCPVDVDCLMLPGITGAAMSVII
jgi:hypothetical protein